MSKIMDVVARNFFLGRNIVKAMIGLTILVMLAVFPTKLNLSNSVSIVMVLTGIFAGVLINILIIRLIIYQQKLPGYAVVQARKLMARRPETRDTLEQLIIFAEDTKSYQSLKNWIARYYFLEHLSETIGEARECVRTAPSDFWTFLRQTERWIGSERSKLLGYDD